MERLFFLLWQRKRCHILHVKRNSGIFGKRFLQAVGEGIVSKENLVDVAINIFAKPFQTALSLLSLMTHSEAHIGRFWLQFEPAGSRYDSITSYHIADYLRDECGADICVFQPETWFDCAVADKNRFHETAYRLALRFEYAFEMAKADRLFLLHNDVFFHKDIVGAMLEKMGDAFAIGPLGQCWNCPASNEEISRKVMNQHACESSSYSEYRPSFSQLQALYAEGDARKLYKRSYSDGLSLFESAPWPLPECRINEWACLVNLNMTQALTIPFGKALPLGCYEQCGSHTLDIGVSWFRAMHAHGLHACHFSTKGWLTHFVGTGHKSRLRYTQAEMHALSLLKRFYPHYVQWLERQCKIAL